MKKHVTLSLEKSCFGNFISWQRLEQQLRAAGEINQNEHITEFEISDSGIEYRVIRR